MSYAIERGQLFKPGMAMRKRQVHGNMNGGIQLDLFLLIHRDYRPRRYSLESICISEILGRTEGRHLPHGHNGVVLHGLSALSLLNIWIRGSHGGSFRPTIHSQGQHEAYQGAPEMARGAYYYSETLGNLLERMTIKEETRSNQRMNKTIKLDSTLKGMELKWRTPKKRLTICPRFS